MSSNQMEFSVDEQNNKVNVQRTFAAPVDKVWAAWTEQSLLDQWWVPKPWKAETKSRDFSVGGRWLYAMVGPNGERHWSFADYQTIDPKNSFSGKDGFCDENGNLNASMPQSLWTVSFNNDGQHTVVNIEIKHEKLSDIKAIMEMGFKEGFTAALGNLDELLAGQAA